MVKYEVVVIDKEGNELNSIYEGKQIKIVRSWEKTLKNLGCLYLIKES